MGYRTVIISLAVCVCMLILPSCEDAKPEPRTFPIIRTLMPADVDAAGATLRAEVITSGSNPTTAFGFLWDTVEPVLETAYSVELGTRISEGVIEKRMESELAGNAVYKVRAYAIQDGVTVYGNTITFKSLGSKASGWTMETAFDELDGGFSPFGGTDGQSGYIIYQLGEAYRYDPVKKSISALPNYPSILSSGAQFATCTYKGKLYVFGSDSKLYTIENNTWKLVSVLPFYFSYFNGYYQAFSYNGLLYLVSSYWSYTYDVENNVWIPISQPPLNSYSVAGTYHQGKVYLLMQNFSFWSLDLSTMNWAREEDYPGRDNQFMVTYGAGSKVYFGIKEYAEFWMFDTDLHQWTAAERFPGTLGVPFYFTIDDTLYYGVETNDRRCTIWSFKPKV